MKAIQKEKLLQQLSELVAFETTADKVKEIQKAFAYIDSQLGFFPFVKKEYEHNGVQSVVWSTQDTKKPDIILNAHVDVVPAKSKNLFSLEQADGHLLARGASDMKFAIVSFIHALEALNEKLGLDNLSIAMMITSDEERGGFNGVNYLVNEVGYRSNLVIIPDAGDDWHITTAAKGASWVKISTAGDSAHASRPWEGSNAIDKLLQVLAHLKAKHSNPQNEQYETTINIGTITGGTTPNQVANEASATLDIRYTEQLTMQDIVAELQKAFPDLEIETLVHKADFKVDPDNKFIQEWIKVLETQAPQLVNQGSIFNSEHGSADHHYFTDHGIPVLATKPGGGLIHTEHEWLSEEEFYLFAELLAMYLIKILKK